MAPIRPTLVPRSRTRPCRATTPGVVARAAACLCVALLACSGAESTSSGVSVSAPSSTSAAAPMPQGAGAVDGEDAADAAPASPAGADAEKAAAQVVKPRRALWVLAEGSARVLEEPARVDRLMREAKALAITDLFVQVHRGGRSWFPSTRADDAPYRAMVAPSGAATDAGSAGVSADGLGPARDPLNDLVRLAHADGMRVHAWFNVLSLAENRDAPLLRALGPGAVLVDRRDRSLLDYTNDGAPPGEAASMVLGTPGLWLDPTHPGLIDYLVATLDELIAASPELDGLHLDFIRHPMMLPIVPGSRFAMGNDFGYGAASKRAFETATGKPFARGDAWDDFRRDAVTDVVRRLDARLPRGWEHSAAVVTYADRAYLSAMQDWRRWLDEGILDFAVAMAYTRDDRMLRYLSHELVGGLAGDRVWLGLGTWLFTRDPARAVRQVEIAEAVTPPGLALFSYDALSEAPEAIAALRPASTSAGDAGPGRDPSSAEAGAGTSENVESEL
jgi:uncharacterized lipoprotein YddW (UPF0748 family)